MLERGGRNGEIAAGEMCGNATLEKTRRLGKKNGRCWQTGGAGETLREAFRSRCFLSARALREPFLASYEDHEQLEDLQTW